MPLPTELWGEIVRQATLVPGAFDTSHTPGVDSPRIDGVDPFYEQHQQSLATKLHTSLVSRTWQQISLPFLFETVIIRDLVTLPYKNFLRLFDPDDGRLSPCRYILRLEVVGGRLDLGFAEPVPVDKLMKRILRKCSRLRIYRHTSVTAISPSTLGVLLALPSRSLRYLDILGIDISSHLIDLVARNAPQLEYLSTNAAIKNCTGLAALSALHTLTLNEYADAGCFSWCLPSLRQLIQRTNSWHEDDDFPLLTDMPTRKSIGTLDVSGSHSPPWQRILDAYPNLDTILSPALLVGQYEINGVYPSLRTVVLIDNDLIVHDRNGLMLYLPVLLTMLLNKGRFPGMRQIRLRGFQIASDQEYGEFWERWASLMADRGICFETDNGDSVEHCLSETRGNLLPSAR